MPRHALVRADNSIERFDDTVNAAKALAAGADAQGRRWLPVVRPAAPAFDPATEVLVAAPVAVNGAQVTEGGFTKRLKTAPELDGEKESKLDAIDRLQFQIAFDIENRMRALEAKPAITAAQYRSALKARL